MTPTYDQARQLGKAYVGALNSGADAFRRLFAPGARVVVGGRPAEDPADVFAVAPPGRSGFRRARLEPPQVCFTIRVRDRESARDLVHRVTVDEAGRIASVEA